MKASFLCGKGLWDRIKNKQRDDEMFLLHAHTTDSAHLSEAIFEIAHHGVIEVLKLVPFLFITYLLIEYIEHRLDGRAAGFISRSGPFAPVLGATLGIIPQCGFSAGASNLYAGGIISLGTLIAVFLSTSDEMLPILISGNFRIGSILAILGYKTAVAMICGVVINLVIRGRKKADSQVGEPCGCEACDDGEAPCDCNDKQAACDCDDGHTAYSCDECQDNQEPCDCDDCHAACGDGENTCGYGGCHDHRGGVLLGALLHTLTISGFILVVTLLINTGIHFIGEEGIGAFIPDVPLISHLFAAVFGLIPNCAASVALTTLCTGGIITSGEMMAGLLSGGGIGLAVLMRANKSKSENALIILILVLIGTVFGYLADFIMPNILL